MIVIRFFFWDMTFFRIDEFFPRSPYSKFAQLVQIVLRRNKRYFEREQIRFSSFRNI